MEDPAGGGPGGFEAIARRPAAGTDAGVSPIIPDSRDKRWAPKHTMPQPDLNPWRLSREFRFRLDGSRWSLSRKLLVMPLVLALFALLFALGAVLWVLFAILTAIVALGGAILAMLTGKRRGSANRGRQVIEGNSRRIDDDTP